jgi:hypothetical protein
MSLSSPSGLWCGSATGEGKKTGTRRDVLFLTDTAREDEFSPLKNAAGAAKDTADTSRNALYQQHRSAPLYVHFLYFTSR